MPETNLLTAIFGQPISTYTRAQALADGVLIDAGNLASQAGFIVPVALTHAAWENCVAWAEEDSRNQVPQEQSGRLWDVLYLARHRIRLASKQASGTLGLSVMRVPRDGKSRRPVRAQLKLHSGAGDNGEQVITIMLPNED